MSDHIYKKLELVGSSPNGFEAAVHNALARAKKTVRNMRWFEVTETRGYVEDGNVACLKRRTQKRLWLRRSPDELFFFLSRLIQLGGAVNQDRGP